MTRVIWSGGVRPPLKIDIGQPCMVEHVGIEFTEAGDDYLVATMPVDERTRQPFGLLHGGASVVLAETLASYASACVIDLGTQAAVGLEINANHVRGVTHGRVTGTVKPLHLGRQTHVWEIRIVDDQQRLVCISRCTIAVLSRAASKHNDKLTTRP